MSHQYSGRLSSLNEQPLESAEARRVRDLVDGTGRHGAESIETIEAEMKRRRQSGHYAQSSHNLPGVARPARADEASAPSAQTRSDSDIFERLANERLERGRVLMRSDATRTDGETREDGEYIVTRLRRENDERIRTAWIGSSDDADES